MTKAANSAMKLTDAQQKFFDSLGDSEKKRLLQLTPEAQAKDIDQMLMIQKASLASKVEDDLVTSTQVETDDVSLFSFNLGGGFPVGSVLKVELLGTMPMFKKEKSDGWQEITGPGGVKRYISSYFRCIVRQAGHPLDGQEIGIYDAASLSILKKIPTLATKVGTPKVNPVVTLRYKEHAQGKDYIKETYGIELQSGNSMHIIDVLYSAEVAATVRRYESGTVNFLKNPIPNFGNADKEELTSFQKDVVSYARNLGIVPESARFEEAQRAIDDFNAGRIQAGAVNAQLENAAPAAQLN